MKSQVKHTHSKPKAAFWTIKSWNLLFPECLASPQPWTSSKEGATSHLYQKVTWSHVNRPVNL